MEYTIISLVVGIIGAFIGLKLYFLSKKKYEYDKAVNIRLVDISGKIGIKNIGVVARLTK